MKRTVLRCFSTALLLLFAKAQEIYTDPTAAVEDRVEDLLQLMTLQEKIGQMIMDMENTPENAPGIGAYMVGAGGLGTDTDPLPNTPGSWRQRQNELQAVSANNRLGIPLFMAADAVHGQNIISGATIFPHNIGLGATRNPSLIRQMAQAAAEECITSALDMTFAPTLAVARTMTWGRTYESLSEDTDTVNSFAAAYIEGFQGTGAPFNVVATAKHWIGDGATTNGIDAGDTALTEKDLMDIHATPFVNAIAADVGSIMISFSSINGTQMHGNEYWITDVLKGDLGFDGFCLSDWEAYTRNPGDYDDQVRLAINAGIDMLMAPYQSYQIFESVENSFNLGLISQDRIDDAVRRVLRVKFKAGLFEKKLDPIDVDTYQPLGTSAHRAVAKQAVRESLVLLKNDNNLLPLQKSARIFLAGKSADNIQNQCGGWTMSWQGTSLEERHIIVGGTTIRDSLESAATNTVTFSVNGAGADPTEHDVAIVVIGETPYAEYEGDRDNLSLDTDDQATIANVQASGVPVVLVVVSGRPLIITDEIDIVDTVVAAWLPGTEGDGIAEVFFGDYDFVGKLSFSWPANMAQIRNGFVGDNPNVLFPFGYGLSYQDNTIATDAPTTSPVDEETPSPSTSSPTETPSQSPSTSAPTTSTETNAPTTSPTEKPSNENEPTEAPSTSAPSSTEMSLDVGIPTVPGTPMLLELTSTSISFSWTASTDNTAVTKYEVYDGSRLVETTTKTSFSDDGLTPNTAYSFTVIALDAAGNESPASDPLSIVTPLLVDNFDDGDDEANWGQWRSVQNGTESDGVCTFETNVAGAEGFGARVVYVIDSGEWGFCNMFLDFDNGNPVDLTQADITGVQFKMQGSLGTTFYLVLGTSLAEFNWKYYKYKLEPTRDWTTVTVSFDQFESDEGVPYTLSQGLQLATSLVFENSIVGQGGWFSIDNVDFLTSKSQPAGVQEEFVASSSVNNICPSWAVLVIMFSIGVLRW